MRSAQPFVAAARLLTAVTLLTASASFGAADTFGLGDGHSNSFTALTAIDVVNAYAPLTVTAAAATSSLTVGATTGTGAFAANDLVMLWQVAGHSGAVSGNQTAIDLTAGVAATHFELGRVLSVAAGNITLTAPLLTTFTGGVTQVVRVPEFTTVTIASGLGITAPAWNGTTGGIVAFLSLNGIASAGTIDASGKGFRAGIIAGLDGNSNCLGNDGAPPQWSTKGEGIQAPASAAVSGGMGNLANAGGGGNCHNAGGAGGGSRGQGGNGGGRWSDNADFGGRGGSSILLGLKQLLLGGGGGAGHVNQSVGTNGSGAPGGGVIFIRASTITGISAVNGTLVANGTGAITNPEQCDPAGGGGGGGTIHLRVSGSAAIASTQASGGKGGDHNGTCAQFQTQAQGVGGGGAAGTVLCQVGSGSCNTTAVGGVAGTAAGVSSIRAQPGGAAPVVVPPTGGFFVATVTAPTAGSATTNQQPTLTTSGDANVTVFIFVDGVQVCTGTSNASGVFSCTPASTFSYATHSVTAQESPTSSLAQAGPVSAAVSFTIAPTPVVTVSAPAVINAANAAAYPVSGTCTDFAGTVSVSVGVVSGTTACVAGAFSTTLNVSALVDGINITVGASQTDALGTGSDSKTTRKDTVVAAPVISTPLAGTQVAPNPNITGTSEALATVTVRDTTSMAVICSTTADNLGAWSCATTLGAGTSTVAAVQTDTAGNVSTDSLSRTFTVVVAPTVTVDPPAVINAANAAAYPVSGTCTTGAGNVIFSVGIIFGTSPCVAGTYGGTLNVSALPDGIGITVGASQTNVAGTGSDSKTTRKDTVVLPPAILVPANGADVAANPTISGTSEASATVTVRDASMAVVCIATANGSGAWSCSTTLGIGSYSVTATQVDTALNPSAASGVTSFRVVAPPTVTVTAPAVINFANAASYPVSGTCTTGAGNVTVTIGTVTNSAVACTAGVFTVNLDVSGLADAASVSVSAAQTNVAGTGTDTKSTRKDTVALPPVISLPATTTEVAVNPTISGTSEAFASITVRDASLVSVCTATADASGNWSCPTTLGVGAYSITATQTDTAGNTSAASGVTTFTVVTPPTVAVNAPGVINGANAAAYPVSGTCTTGAGAVTVSVGTVTNSSVVCTAGAFTVNLDVSGLADAASISVSASQTNVAGTVTDTKSTRKDTAALAPAILLPADGTTTGLNPTISGTSEPLATVTVRDAALAVVCTATANATGGWSCATTLTAGSYAITATQVDTAGNTSTASPVTGFTVVSTPAVGLNAPPVINATSAASYTVSGTCVDAAGPVTVAVGSVSNGTVVCTGGVFTVSLDVSGLADAASVNVSASQTNVAGTGSVVLTTRKDTSALAPVIGSPLAGARVGPAASFSGTGEIGATVTVTEGLVTVCTATVDSSGNWSCNVTLTAGPHAVTATQVDTAGNTSPASAPTAFTVAPVPSVTIDTPGPVNAANASAYTVTGHCTTVDGQVTVIVGTIVSTTACTAGVFSTTLNVSALADVAPLIIRASQSNITGVGSDTKQTVKDTQAAPPVVISPANGTTTALNPVISGTAEANAVVVLTEGGTTLCTTTADSSGQWSCSTTLGVGAHSVNAVQTDLAGNVSLPSVANFTVANVPRVLLTTPAIINGANAAAYTVAGSCSSAAGAVQISVGSVTASTPCTAGSFSATLDVTAVPDGNRVTVSASQTDATGTGSDSKVAVKDTIVAAPAIASPGNGSVVGLSPTITGRGEPLATVTVREGTTVVCTVTADSKGFYSCPTTFGIGSYTVTATQTDLAGNVSTASSAVGFSVSGSPSVSLSAPGVINGANAAAYPVSGTCDSSASQVTVTIAGVTTTAACTGGVFSAVLDVSGLGDASGLTISAAQTNLTGTTTVEAMTAKDTVANAPVVTSPAQGSTVGPMQTLTGTAEPGATVTVSEGATVVCQAIADSNGQWFCGTALAVGAHSLTASERDVAGNASGPSTAVAFNVVLKPVVTLNTLPRINGANQKASVVSGTCTVGAGPVSVTVGSLTASAACTDGMFVATLDVTAQADGAAISVTATQTNPAGTARATSSVAKDATAPGAPVITAPEGNASVTSVPVVTGTAEANATVTVSLDGTVVGTAQANAAGAWTFTLPATTSVGAHVVTATAMDAAGNTGARSNDGAFTLTKGVTSALPTLSTPVSGSTVLRDEALVVSGKSGAGSSVDVFIDGTKVGTATADANGDWALRLEPNTLSAGPHTAEARNQAGKAETAFTVKTRTQQQLSGGGCGCTSSGFEPLIGLLALWLGARRRRSS